MSSENRFKLTNASVRERCVPPSPGEQSEAGNEVKARFYWDSELRGFGVVVHRPRDQDEPTRTFVIQRDVRRRTRRVKIGRFPELTADEARKRARKLYVEMDDGTDPNARKREEAAKGTTLDEAIRWHQEAMTAKGCVRHSIETVRYELGLHLSDWIRRPLAELTRNDCAARHRRITQGRGPYVANRVLRHLRAVYNTASRRLEDLPRNPTVAVTYNRERRRREPIPWGNLPAWLARVDAIENPIRRDLQLFILFTGLRATDAKTVRWEDVNLGTTAKLRGRVEVPPGCMHRPRPKGGVDRAFTVPLSEYVLDLLRRRERENSMVFGDDCDWIFPARSSRGHVTHTDSLRESSDKSKEMPSPHRLRDTFASAAHEAGVHPLDLKVLMNHVVSDSGNVTEGYIRPSVDHLRTAVERVSAFLRGKMHPVPNLRAEEPPSEAAGRGETA